MTALRPNKQGEVIADFSDAGITRVEGSFIVRVATDEFRDQEILSGDLVIFDPTDSATIGRIVAVESDDGPLHVCRCESESQRVAGIAVGLIRVL